MLYLIGIATIVGIKVILSFTNITLHAIYESNRNHYLHSGETKYKKEAEKNLGILSSEYKLKNGTKSQSHLAKIRKVLNYNAKTQKNDVNELLNNTKCYQTIINDVKPLF